MKRHFLREDSKPQRVPLTPEQRSHGQGPGESGGGVSLRKTLLWGWDSEQQLYPCIPPPAARDPGPAARSQRRGAAPPPPPSRGAHTRAGARPRHSAAPRSERSDLGRSGQRRPTPARPPACASGSGTGFPRPPRVLLPIIPVSVSVPLLALSLSLSFRHTHTRTHTHNLTPIYTLEKKTLPSRLLPPHPKKLNSRVVGAPRTVWKC